MDVLSVEVPIFVAVLSVVFVGIPLIDDNILATLLSTMASQFVAIVFAAALVVALFTIAAAKWLKLGREPTFQRYGGAAIGGAFGALLIFSGAALSFNLSSTYSSLETAQNTLLTVIAEQHRFGDIRANILMNTNAALKITISRDGNLLSATSTRFDGSLIAEGLQDIIKVYWDADKRHNLGNCI
jgi:hypothetical protein